MEFVINDDLWEVKFVRKLPGCLGECDPSTNVIKILKGQNKFETLKTMIHEIIHATEFSYDFELEHRIVYLLEESIACVLAQTQER